MRKINYLFVVALLSACSTFAQVGIGTTAPEAHLDITSTTAGLLIPRGALSSLTDVTTFTNPQGGAPVVSTLVYNNGTGGVATAGFYYWDGTIWVMFTTKPSTDWTIEGNTGTDPNTNFVGTTDGNDFVTRTNNTERMRVTSAGNVGVGEANPQATFEVAGNLVIGDTYTGGTGVAQPGGLTIEGRTILGDDDFYYSLDKLVVYGNTNWVPTSPTSTDNGNGLFYALNGYTYNGTAVYGEDNDGGTGIEGAVDGTALARPIGVRGYDVGGVGTGVIGISANSGTSPTAGYIGVMGVESTLTGYAMYALGDRYISGTDYGPSDKRLKKNIAPLNNALDIVNQLQPKTYEYRHDENKFKRAGLSNRPQMGFIAQELEQVLPELIKETDLVLESKNYTKKELEANPKLRNEQDKTMEIKAVNTTQLIPLLTQAIKEQQTQIEALKARIEVLENK